MIQRAASRGEGGRSWGVSRGGPRPSVAEGSRGTGPRSTGGGEGGASPRASWGPWRNCGQCGGPARVRGPWHCRGGRHRSVRGRPRKAVERAAGGRVLSGLCCRRDQVLQQRRSPLVTHGQSRHLLGEGHLRAERVLVVQTAHGQVNPDGPAAECRIGEVPDITAMDPVAQDTASAASRWNTGAGRRLNHHDRTGGISRKHQYPGQVP